MSQCKKMKMKSLSDFALQYRVKMAGWPNTCPSPTKVHAGQVLVAKPCAFSLTLTLSQLRHQRKSSPLCSSVSLLVIQSQRQRVQVSPRRLFCHSLPSEGAKMAQHMSHQVKVGLGQKWSRAKGIGKILKMSQHLSLLNYGLDFIFFFLLLLFL